MATISVVIPAYNREKFVGEAIQSVLDQTYRECEIVVVDDGSTDRTAAVVERFGDAVRLIRQNNRGSAGARNTGLHASTSEFVAFLDADDLWDREFVEALLTRLLAAPNVDVVYCGWRYVDANGGALPQIDDVALQGRLIEQLAVTNLFPQISALTRRSRIRLIGGFDETLRTREDWDLWQRIALSGGCFAYVPRVLSSYRVHGENKLSSMALESQLDFQLDLLRRFYARSDLPPGIAALQGRAFANVYLNTAVTYCAASDLHGAARAFANGVHAWPDLLFKDDTYYRLICADQPLGFRDTEFYKDLRVARRRINRILTDAFTDPRLRALKRRESEARGRAALAIAIHEQRTDHRVATLRSLGEFAWRHPRGLGAAEPWRLLLRTIVGQRLLAQARAKLVFR